MAQKAIFGYKVKKPNLLFFFRHLDQDSLKRETKGW